MDKRLPRLRRKLLPWLLLSAGVSMLCTIPAAHAETPRLRPGAFVWQPERSPDQGVVTVLVSLSEQLAHVYRDDVRIATTTISSGRSGHRTPTGVYPILEKRVKHFSNLYDNAPMPYMQRLTWDGIALHGGNLPGYPASHGCIRLPHRFAKLLFEVTARGETTVIVTNSPTPKKVESLNGSLLALQQAGDKTMLAFSGLILDTLSAHQERDPFNPNAQVSATNNLTSASAAAPATPPAVPVTNNISNPSTTSSATTNESLPSSPPLAKAEPLSEVKLNYSPRFSQKLSVNSRVATEIKSVDLVLKPLDKPAVAVVVASNAPAPAANSGVNPPAPTLTINAPTAKPVEAVAPVLASNANAAKPAVSATAKPAEAVAPVLASNANAAAAKPAETMPMPPLSELTLVSTSSKAPSPDREFWNPEQVREGTLRVLVSGADRMLYVYRGKTLIGQGRVQIEQPNYPLGERTVFAIDLFERSSGTPNSDLLRRIQLPATLSTRLYELADPKTLVTITNASAAAHLARSSNWLALAD